jgi:diguanylate cyclase (GGDEF)-like protein
MSTAAESLDHHVLVHTRAAWSFLAFSVAMCVVYLVARSEVVAAIAFGTVAGGAVVAIGMGLRQHQPSTRTSWKFLLAASVLFLVGGVLRMDGNAAASSSALVPALFTVSGYAAVGAALAVWLRIRNVNANTDTVLDTILFGLGGALASWVLLIAPLTTGGTVVDRTTVISAMYPVLDVVLLTLLVHLALTTAPGDHSFGLLGLSLVAIFVGDLGYAVTSADILSIPSSVIDAPFLIGYGALGAGALHPSMNHLSTPQPRLSYRGHQRFTGITVVMVIAALALAAVSTRDTTDRWVRAVLFAAVLFGVLLRSERAVRRYAASESAARHQSLHDPLTGLPNRVSLHASASAQLGEPGTTNRLSMLFIDLDGFKFVNDSYGHSVGDELLIAAAERLSEMVRSADVVARYGGDEFVIAASLERAAAEGLANRILTVFSEPFGLSVGRVYVSASIGIARSGTSSQPSDIESLIREADAAMYHAKAHGRGGYAFFDDSLRAQARIQIETSTALRDALARNEFEVYYQPIVDLGDFRTVGYEALLRWSHDGVSHSPDEFIPIAEASNIIVPIGAWVLRTACTQLASWWAAGHRSLHMAVNVSARQLRDDEEFVNTVRTVLAETGLPGHALWFELTETAFVDDTEAALRALQALRTLGSMICVDDFGTGYSVLGYMHRFPITVVKIDGTFVKALGEQQPESSIVSAIRQMSTALGMVTVAEGVETELQETQLRALGCDMGQGYRYGHPLPARSIPSPDLNSSSATAAERAG